MVVIGIQVTPMNQYVMSGLLQKKGVEMRVGGRRMGCEEGWYQKGQGP